MGEGAGVLLLEELEHAQVFFLASIFCLLWKIIRKLRDKMAEKGSTDICRIPRWKLYM